MELMVGSSMVEYINHFPWNFWTELTYEQMMSHSAVEMFSLR